MNGTTSMVERLLRGPRGRRLLLEFAIASDGLSDYEYRADSFASGVFQTSYDLDPGKGTSVKMYWNADGAGQEIPSEEISLAEIASRLDAVRLAEVTPELLRECLAETVDSARYWQEADGTDVLAGTEEMRRSLRRVALHVAASAHAAWWVEPMAERSQWQVEWDGVPTQEIVADPMALLHQARSQTVEKELVARRERPSDATANWSGEWWSCPPMELPSTTRALPDESPAALWFVEDGRGWEQANARALEMPAGACIYEIDSAEAWASLCAKFPIEVTAQKRHDWYRTTGRDGAWVIPDWATVAEHYDAVHLQVGAYLSAAGTAIPVDEQTASVIAGWDPDQTYWFTPNIRISDELERWTLEVYEGRSAWVRQRSQASESK